MGSDILLSEAGYPVGHQSTGTTPDRQSSTEAGQPFLADFAVRSSTAERLAWMAERQKIRLCHDT